MTTSSTSPLRRGRWIADWRPEDPTFWRTTGARIARRNLIWSIFAEHLGFSVWMIWSVSSALLASVGFDFSPQQLFFMVAIPSLVGALLRLPYTFAVPRFGARNWTMFSASALLVPTVGYALAVTHEGTPYWLFCVIAAFAGLGGGNFASGTFGSFMGYSSAMPLLIKLNFWVPDPAPLGTGIYFAYFAFLGAGIGSLTRPLGGWLADRYGGARVTLAAIVGIIVFTLAVVWTLAQLTANPTAAPAIAHANESRFWWFLAFFLLIFAATGIGNGSAYK